jgi:hypothetical protein
MGTRGTTYPGHLPTAARAKDFAGSVAQQNRLAAHFRANHAKYGIMYIISRMRIASARGGWGWRAYHPISTRGDFRHMAHVHASFYGRGTNNARRGLAVVGENGPEAMELGGGERITPLNKLSAAMSAPGPRSLAQLPSGSAARGWARGEDTPNPRPIMITVDLGDGVTKKIQGVLDEHDEFHASMGRAR